MADFVLNPRRAPRALSRCIAQIEAPEGSWEAETEDIGPHGCQLVAPTALPRGRALRLTIASLAVAEELHVAGRVAWIGTVPPWRLGVSFDEPGRPGAARWFEALVAATPGLASVRRVPERLPTDAVLFLGPPPRFVVDFSPDELEVIRNVGGGVQLGALRDRLAASWPRALRALFGLLARQVLTLSRGASAHPESWRPILVEAGLTFSSDPVPLRRSARATPAPTPAPAPVSPRSGSPAPPPPPLGSRRAEAAEMRGADLAAADLAASPAPSAAPGAASAGSGWRGAAAPRSSEAQALLDRARAELAAGRAAGAVALLQRALMLAPGDPEVAVEIARALRAGR